MNCVRCNLPLEANARFCRNCGLPVTNPASTPDTNANSGSGRANPSPISSDTDAPTVPPTSWQAPRQQQTSLSGQPAQPTPMPQAQQWQQQEQQAWMPTLFPPSPASQPHQQNELGTMRPGATNQPQQRPLRRRGRVGCFIGAVIALVLVVALLIGGRFVLRSIAINQINQTFSNAINDIPSVVAILPERNQTINEDVINALFSHLISATDPVQHITIHFTPNDMEIDFNVYSFSSSITAVPKIVNGQFVMTNVTVQGIAGLILSSGDITNLMNTQITNLETHIQHTITAVTLQNRSIVLRIAPNGSTPTLPTTPPIPLPTGLPTLPPLP
jgi:hypothetical protein